MLLTARKRVRPPPALAPVLETAITAQIAAPPLLSSRSPSEYSSAPPSYAIPSRRRSRYVSSSFETSSSPPPRKRHIGDTIQTMIEPVTPPTHPQPTIEERLDEQDEVIGEMYEHVLEIPLLRIDEIEQELQTFRTRVVAT
ncbi:hypothetical protein Tco_1217720 [Tanacetum coccineum]